MMRGFAVIALDNPKCGENVGGALRAAGVYGAAAVVLGGPRPGILVKHPTNTMMAHRHIPTLCVDDVFSALSYDTVPIAVELVDDATPLPEFNHPERAFYVFGAEDATLGARVLDRCKHRVVIPTRLCMNLAATVNVVL